MNKEDIKVKGEQVKEEVQKKEKEASAKVKEFNETGKAKAHQAEDKAKEKVHEKSEKAKAHQAAQKAKAHEASEKAKANLEVATSPEHVESKARAHGEAMGAEVGKVAKVVDEFKSGVNKGMNDSRQSKSQTQEAPQTDVIEQEKLVKKVKD
jgi:hypothetical protein